MPEGGSQGGMKDFGGGGASGTSEQLGMRPRWSDSHTAPNQKASVTLCKVQCHTDKHTQCAPPCFGFS